MQDVLLQRCTIVTTVDMGGTRVWFPYGVHAFQLYTPLWMTEDAPRACWLRYLTCWYWSHLPPMAESPNRASGVSPKGWLEVLLLQGS